MYTKKSIKRSSGTTGKNAIEKHDHWLNISSNDLKSDGSKDDQDDEDEDDSYTYLYSYKSDPNYSSNANDKTTGSKLESVKAGNAEKNGSDAAQDVKDKHSDVGRSQDDSTDASPNGFVSIDSPLTVPHSSYCGKSFKIQSSPNFETSYIKRGKFKGFFDDRRYRCLYGNFDETSRCNIENCYCINAPIYESPLRFEQSVDSFSDSESLEFEDNKLVKMLPNYSPTEPVSLFHNSNDDISTNIVSLSSSAASKPSLVPLLPSPTPSVSIPNRPTTTTQTSDRNSRVLSKVKQKFDHSLASSANSLTSEISSGFSEKLSKRVKKYHSVNNLSKRSSLRQHFVGDLNPSMKDEPFELPRPQTAKPNNRHKYLKSFRLHRDVVFVNSTRNQRQREQQHTCSLIPPVKVLH